MNTHIVPVFAGGIEQLSRQLSQNSYQDLNLVSLNVSNYWTILIFCLQEDAKEKGIINKKVVFDDIDTSK